VKTAYRLALAIALGACGLTASLAQPAVAQVRTYYVAADEVLWNYVPSGTDLLTGKRVSIFAPTQLGWTYHKLVYVQYTDGTFARVERRAPGDAYLGNMGPVMHAVVGDTIVVHFRNHTRYPVDIEPIGGVMAAPAKPVPAGEAATYSWEVPDTAGPGPSDASSTLWTYDSNGAHPGADDYAGLIGPIVVTRAGDARPDGSPADVDREVFALFKESQEEQSALWSENYADPRTNPRKVKSNAITLLGTNIFVSINGYSFANMPMVTLHRGEHVRWYVFDGYADGDAHIPTWNGNTVIWQGHRADTVTLGGTQPDIADMVPDNVGTWLLYCTLNIHLEGGMDARYQVVP
jgi:hypothetical protein